jgi:hypothetical protein
VALPLLLNRRFSPAIPTAVHVTGGSWSWAVCRADETAAHVEANLAPVFHACDRRRGGDLMKLLPPTPGGLKGIGFDADRIPACAWSARHAARTIGRRSCARR